MTTSLPVMDEASFMLKFSQNPEGYAWFLGAGTSRSANLPTAADIIWDLKLQHYCIKQNQDLRAHDISNSAVRLKIQSYMDGLGYPALWDPTEYSFYFDKIFGADYAAQQKYIAGQLDPSKTALCIGHRALAAMMGMGATKAVFTTNFDEVIEKAYAFVHSQPLSVFHLEGSYAALEALNAGKHPIYAKIHGDFRYQSIKNLSADLISNDEKIRQCLIAACTRFGLVVSGYSGRDANVMQMLHDVLAQNNPYPHGLFWTVTSVKNVSTEVQALLIAAQAKGVKTGLVEAGTFDSLLAKIWRQLKPRSDDLDKKVYTGKAVPVNIALPEPGTGLPILRTNALAITVTPGMWGVVNTNSPITYQEMNQRLERVSPDITATHDGSVIFFGRKSEATKLFTGTEIKDITSSEIGSALAQVKKSKSMKAFFEKALIAALVEGKPVQLRRDKGKVYYVVVDSSKSADSFYDPLRAALTGKFPPKLSGAVSRKSDLYWSEAISLKLEERNDQLWLMLRPEIWVSPMVRRHEAVDYIRERRRFRYNPMSSQILDAWIKMLCGERNQEISVIYRPESEFPAEFKILTRTAYGRKP